MHKILVTGAGGFIGSHLVEALATRGATVRAFVRYTSRADIGLLAYLPEPILDGVEIIAGDLRDQDAVRRAVEGVDLIFHLGALIAIPYSYLHPTEVVETNVMGTLNILLAARDLGIPRLVHTSTSEVYGSALRVPIDEGHPLQGQSPYSASKIGADKLAESFYSAYDLPVVTVRPFNTYGPRQSARAVIPTIISQVLTRDQLHIGRLDTRRDFTFMDDTVAGFLKAGEAIGVEGDLFNLGTGEDVTIQDIIDMVFKITGTQLPIIQQEVRMRPDKSEVTRLLSDNSKAAQILGWTPTIDLETGLRQTVAWIAEHIDAYRPGKYQR
ncbi:MAG: GDP-mannose 4,6-dehydratase [Brevefilum sp.]|nr:GDP-mannose 4,6-dehydratase [Brevefilum sp.]